LQLSRPRFHIIYLPEGVAFSCDGVTNQRAGMDDSSVERRSPGGEYALRRESWLCVAPLIGFGNQLALQENLT
jgi:hypothetical protein